MTTEPMNRHTNDKGGSPEPCPFCGGEAEVFDMSPADDTWSARCCECDAAMIYVGLTEAEAIAAWNTRAYNPNKRLREALVEAREQLWHLAKDPDDNYLIKRIDAALSTTVESHEEVEALKHDLTRQMSIANAECNEVERLREMLEAELREAVSLLETVGYQPMPFILRKRSRYQQAREVIADVHFRLGNVIAALSHTIPID